MFPREEREEGGGIVRGAVGLMPCTQRHSNPHGIGEPQASPQLAPIMTAAVTKKAAVFLPSQKRGWFRHEWCFRAPNILPEQKKCVRSADNPYEQLRNTALP